MSKTIVTDEVCSKNGFAIETVNLSKVYRLGATEVWALRDFTISIKKGEFLAVVGPSGSGKSTLLNLLGALDRPTRGKILVDGIDMSRLNGLQLARLRNWKIGFIFQSFNLINRMSVLRNVEVPAIVRGLSREERRKRATELLKAVGIADKANRKPTALSGGEQQRVAIARALINDPTFILADEPTGNVDTKTGRQIFRLLKEMNRKKNTTIIVVTHNMELANEASKMVHLRDGAIEKVKMLRR